MQKQTTELEQFMHEKADMESETVLQLETDLQRTVAKNKKTMKYVSQLENQVSELTEQLKKSPSASGRLFINFDLPDV